MSSRHATAAARFHSPFWDRHLHPHPSGVVEKCGQSQDKLKADFKELMRKCCTLMPAPKVLAYIKDGLDSKNNRTRVACAEEIAAMVDREGQKVGSGLLLGRCEWHDDIGSTLDAVVSAINMCHRDLC
jgi:hypothetical protein